MSPDPTSSLTAGRRAQLVQSLCELLAGCPDERLDAELAQWTDGVTEPTDVLLLVADARDRTRADRTRRHAERLERAQRIGVADVSARLVRHALTDALTGLATRARLEEEVQRLIAASTRTQAPLTAVVLDVDGLKQINDARGHAAGDEAIAEVGRAIRAHLRLADHAFRIGGDEFALILPDTTAEGAAVLVQRIRRSSATSVSAGIATYRGRGLDDDLALWLGRADAELYASRKGRAVAAAPVRSRRRGLLEPLGLALASLAVAGTGMLAVPAALHALSGGSHGRQAAVPVPSRTPSPAARAQAARPLASPSASRGPIVVRVVVPVLQPVSLPVVVPTQLPVVVATPDLPTPQPTPSGLVSGVIAVVRGLLSS